MIAGSTTALNDAIKAAYDAGIPVVTSAGAVTSQYAINVDLQLHRAGATTWPRRSARPIGAGNLMVEGIAGSPIVAQERRRRQGLRRVSGLSIVAHGERQLDRATSRRRSCSGDRHQSGADRRRLDHRQRIRVVAEGFAEAGQPAPLITGSISGDALGYWEANPDAYRFEGHALLPGWAAQTLYRAGPPSRGPDGRSSTRY